MPTEQVDASNDDDVAEVRQLTKTLGDSPIVRFIGALLHEYPEPVNVKEMCRTAGVGSRQTYYRHEQRFMDTGLVERHDDGRLDKLRLIPDDDQRHMALRILAGQMK